MPAEHVNSETIAGSNEKKEHQLMTSPYHKLRALTFGDIYLHSGQYDVESRDNCLVVYADANEFTLIERRGRLPDFEA